MRVSPLVILVDRNVDITFSAPLKTSIVLKSMNSNRDTFLHRSRLKHYNVLTKSMHIFSFIFVALVAYSKTHMFYDSDNFFKPHSFNTNPDTFHIFEACIGKFQPK